MASPVPVLPEVGSMIVPPGLQAAVALRGLDHADRDAVLDRAAGVEDLELRDDLGLQAGADAGQPDERRVPDRVEDRVLDLGHGPEDKVAGVGEVGRVVGLWRYPVKSMAAEALSSVEVGFAGFAGDRRWAFVRGDVPRSGFPWMTIREDAAMLEHVPRFVEPGQPDKSRVMVRTPGGRGARRDRSGAGGLAGRRACG